MVKQELKEYTENAVTKGIRKTRELKFYLVKFAIRIVIVLIFLALYITNREGLVDMMMQPNIPVGLAAFLFASKIIPDVPKTSAPPFDLKGAVLIFIAVIFGIFTIERLPHMGLNLVICETAVLAVFSLTLFVLHELKT